MKGSLMSAIHHLRTSKEYLEDFMRQTQPNSRGRAKIGEYVKKMQWIISDMITYPHFGEDVRQGLRQEAQSDSFAYVSIAEKCSLLNPGQREMLDAALDAILAGEDIRVEFNKDKECVF